MADAEQTQTNGATQQDLPLSTSEQWARLEQQADAYEGTLADGKPHQAALKAAEQVKAEQAKPAEPKAEEKPPEQEPAQEGEQTQPAAEAADDGKAKPSGRDTKREQLQSLAAELGLKVDERVVTPDDRVQFRAEKRKFRATLAQQQKDLEQQGAQFQAFQEAQAAFSSGDVWTGLEKLGQDPNELNRAAARRLDPALAEQHELRKRLDEQQAVLDRQKQAQDHAVARRAYADNCQKHRTEIAAEWARSDDPVLKLAAQRPGLVEQARAYSEHIERQEGEQISSAEAAAVVLPRAREAYEGLKAIFGDQATPPSKPETDTTSTGTQAAPKSEAGGNASTTQSGRDSATRGGKPPKAISQSSAAEVHAPQPRTQTDVEWKRRWGQKLKESTPNRPT